MSFFSINNYATIRSLYPMVGHWSDLKYFVYIVVIREVYYTVKCKESSHIANTKYITKYDWLIFWIMLSCPNKLPHICLAGRCPMVNLLWLFNWNASFMNDLRVYPNPKQTNRSAGHYICNLFKIFCNT